MQAQAKSFKSTSKLDGAESFHLDAASDDDSEAGLDEDGQPETKETRQERARMLGLDWEEEDSDESDQQARQDPERRRRLDEAEEMEEFLEFARQELGLGEAELKRIMSDRKESGRWVPGASQKPPPSPSGPPKEALKDDPSKFGTGFSKGFLSSKTSKPSSLQSMPSQIGPKEVSFAANGPAQASVTDMEDEPEATEQPRLDSFGSLMAAMDSTLDAHRRAKGLPPLDREQAYGGEVRAEDWALRRAGGASLGSVYLQQQKEQAAEPKDGGEGSSTPQPTTEPAHEQDEDMADEDLEPLSANDQARLDRLLSGEDEASATFDEMVEAARQQRLERGATGPSVLDRTEAAFERPEPSKITELFHNGGAADDDHDEEMPDLQIDSDVELGENPEDALEGADEKVLGNLMESWRAQGGNAGPMSTLAGGMGFGTQAPRR